MGCVINTECKKCKGGGENWCDVWGGICCGFVVLPPCPRGGQSLF